MRPFNLAEAKITERHYCKLHVNKRMRVIVMIIVLVAIVAMGSQAGKIAVRTKASQVKSQLADRQQQCAERKQNMAALQARSSQEEWFQQLGAKSEIWLNVLDATLGCVPGDVWLSTIKSSPTDFTLDIDGHAASFEALSVFMSKLRLSAEFSEVRLTGSRTGDTTAVKTLDFTLKLTLKDAESLKNASAGAAQAGTVPQAQETQ